jgi:hypothetical protein
MFEIIFYDEKWSFQILSHNEAIGVLAPRTDFSNILQDQLGAFPKYNAFTDESDILGEYSIKSGPVVITVKVKRSFPNNPAEAIPLGEASLTVIPLGSLNITLLSSSKLATFTSRNKTLSS